MAVAESTQITLRECEARDVGRIHELVQRNFALPYSRDTLAQYRHRARGGFLIAELNGEIVGFVVATSPMISVFSGRTGEITLVAVDAPYRRRGIGTQLMLAGMELLRRRSMRWVRLHVEVRNHKAIALYQRLGFAIARTVPGYYRDGSDAFEMLCPLQEEV